MSNKKYIDRGMLLKALNVFRDTENGNQHFLNGIESAREIIKNMPCSRVQKVVYCGECRYYSESSMTCSALCIGTDSDGYCSAGEL